MVFGNFEYQFSIRELLLSKVTRVTVTNKVFIIGKGKEMNSVDPTKFTAKLFESARKLNQPRKAGKIYSSSYFECALKQWYGLTGTPQTDDTYQPEYDVAADLGNTIHAHLQKWLANTDMIYLVPSFDENSYNRSNDRKNGVLWPAIELPFREFTLTGEMCQLILELGLGGRLDAIVRQSNGQLAILDIKTIDEKYFSSGYEKYLKERQAHWSAQLQLYMHIYRTPEGQQITNGLIYLVNRSDIKEVKMFHTTYHKELMDGEIDRLRELRQAVKTNTAPTPDPSRGPCRFCNWQKACPTTERERNNGGFRHV